MFSLQFGVVSTLLAQELPAKLICLHLPDWAGGPGNSKEDVMWLDQQLAQFFADNADAVGS